MRLILASSSKVRQEIFDMIGWKYETISSNAEEISSSKDPRQYAMDLSKSKATEVQKHIEGEALIISADSIAYMDGEIFGKPKSKQEAFEMTKKMSGKMNYAITGVTIKDTYHNKEITFYDETEVHFKILSDDEIRWYVENQEHLLERAGYSLEGKTAMFVSKIVGDYYNVLGMPISKLYDKLHELGYTIRDFEFK